MNEKSPNSTEGKLSKISELISESTSIDDRIRLTSELLPLERKQEKLANGSRDSKGRPVRYFRLMRHDELGCLMSQGESSSIGNPNVRMAFAEKQQEIVKAIQRDHQLIKLYPQEVSDLLQGFNYDSYINFLYRVISRIELLKIHILGEDIGVNGKTTGLTSLSVGIPISSPYYPHLKKDSGPGFVAVELSIPDKDVVASPLFKKYPNLQFEREVDTLGLLDDWIIDVYHDDEDLEQRFFMDESTVMYPAYKKEADESGYIRSQENLMMEFKYSEGFEESLPTSKLPELEMANPIWQQPLSPH